MSDMPQVSQAELDDFWQIARVRANLNQLAVYTGPTPLDTLQPPAWAFGGGPEQADELLDLVLAGTKRATAGALWDYEAEDEALPRTGDLAILLDGAAHPRALIAVTQVDVVPFNEVDAEFAATEGEGDGSLDYWRRVHQHFFSTFAAHDRGFHEDMPVVLERFTLLYPPGVTR